MSEKLSALLDGELSDQEREQALREISRDPALADTWSRYHLYRAVFQEESVNHNPALLERIVHRLKTEVVETMEPDPDHSPAEDQNVVELVGRASVSKRPVFAIAASLVAATILAVFMASYTPTKPAPPLIVELESNTKWEMDREHEDELNGFLVRHGEFTPASGMNGLTSYARFVSYDARSE